MTPEKNDKKLTYWLLAATIALLALVLCLQLWQMFSKKEARMDPAASPASGAASSVSPGRTAMIEDVRTLNPALSFDDLAALSAEELEQLYEAGAPGLPIGVSAAAEAAERHAGTLEADSVTSETDPELDEAPPHYEVELHHPALGDFEYKIDAYTGEVLEGAPHILQSAYVPAPGQELPASGSGEAAPAPAPGAETPAAPTPVAPAPAATGEEAAKNAAFTHAGVSAADASVTKCELDWGDGVQVYEIEFLAGGVEYEYEINAATGAVHSRSVEAFAPSGGRHSEPQPSPDAALVGLDAAKSAALTHAGCSADEVVFTKAELDYDNGRAVYDIEFRKGWAEYEYKIDAAAGNVLEYDWDWD